MLQERLDDLCPSIPLKELIETRNAYVESLLRNAMVSALSDYGLPPPSVFRQSEKKIIYAKSP